MEAIDMIVYATGYNIEFPFLDSSIVTANDNQVGLYKMVVHPQHDSLFFLGLVQPWGSIMPLAERQAEWVAELIDGSCQLPCEPEMLQDIAQTKTKMQQRYASSPRHTIQVDFYSYLDAIDREQRNGRKRAKRLSIQRRETRKAA